MSSAPLRARVQGGRLVLDAPTDLPEGTEVEVQSVDDLEADPELRSELEASIREHAPGTGVLANTFLAELRTGR